MATIELDLNSVTDYETFLKVKLLPTYKVRGRTLEFPDEYLDRLGLAAPLPTDAPYEPIPGLFDYQRAITSLATYRRKFAVFAECGLGKTLIMTEFARYAKEQLGEQKRVLIVSPLMVIDQTIAEIQRFYRPEDGMTVTKIKAATLPDWIMRTGTEIGITNYEAMTEDLPQGNLGCLILDKSSYLKSHYGKWGQVILRLGCGLGWKLALTGTPAPNDRIEYANHAVFMDAFPTVNSFLARFFVNRGQTNERWELKPHALGPFYRALSHWCIFLTNPATYGWKDNSDLIPPIHVHIEDVPLSTDQARRARDLTGTLFARTAGGIGDRSKLARIAKTGDTLKPAFIRSLIESWPDESTIVWCRFNDEQDTITAALPGCASLTGATPMAERMKAIDDFKAGRIKVLVSKPKILGFGLNLQIATRQIFSSLHDSYEEFHQAVKRSNRIGSTRPLNVHVPITELERPMVENVLRKADRVQSDTDEQERIFKNESLQW